MLERLLKLKKGGEKMARDITRLVGALLVGISAIYLVPTIAAGALNPLAGPVSSAEEGTALLAVICLGFGSLLYFHRRW